MPATAQERVALVVGNSAYEHIAPLRNPKNDAGDLTAKLEGPTSDFATTGLPQMTAAAISLQEAAESLNRLASEAQASPRSLIGKAPSKEKEVAR